MMDSDDDNNNNNNNDDGMGMGIYQGFTYAAKKLVL